MAIAGGGNLEEFPSDRNTDNDRFAGGKIPRGLFEVDERPLRAWRHPAVDQAGIGIRLEDGQRRAAEGRRQHQRAGGVAADTQYHVRTVAVQNLHCLPAGARQCQKCFQAHGERLTLQHADLKQFEGKTGGRHQARLDAAMSAHKQNLARGVAAAKLSGQNQRRDHMAPGAAPGDKQFQPSCSTERIFSLHSACRLILSRIPVAARAKNSELPP